MKEITTNSLNRKKSIWLKIKSYFQPKREEDVYLFAVYNVNPVNPLTFCDEIFSCLESELYVNTKVRVASPSLGTGPDCYTTR